MKMAHVCVCVIHPDLPITVLNNQKVFQAVNVAIKTGQPTASDDPCLFSQGNWLKI